MPIYKQEKLCSFTQKGQRLQLTKITTTVIGYPSGQPIEKVMYVVNLNRKKQGSSISEYSMRKLFALMVQNIVLQLKIY